MITQKSGFPALPVAARVAAICNGGERLSRGDQLILHTAVSQDPRQTPRGETAVLPQGTQFQVSAEIKSSRYWHFMPLAILFTLQGKSQLCIPFLGIARPQSKFPHSCVCEDWSTYFPAAE
jgi:hypothetical protein